MPTPAPHTGTHSGESRKMALSSASSCSGSGQGSLLWILQSGRNSATPTWKRQWSEDEEPDEFIAVFS
jgi:hypothetical protein